MDGTKSPSKTAIELHIIKSSQVKHVHGKWG